MKYEVRKARKVFMRTESKRCRYSPSVEASIQSAGYDIYVDGKRLPRNKQTTKNQEVKHGKNN